MLNVSLTGIVKQVSVSSYEQNGETKTLTNLKIKVKNAYKDRQRGWINNDWWVSAVAFAAQADLWANLSEGDAVEASGTPFVETYTNKKSEIAFSVQLRGPNGFGSPEVRAVPKEEAMVTVTEAESDF